MKLIPPSQVPSFGERLANGLSVKWLRVPVYRARRRVIVIVPPTAGARPQADASTTSIKRPLPNGVVASSAFRTRRIDLIDLDNGAVRQLAQRRNVGQPRWHRRPTRRVARASPPSSGAYPKRRHRDARKEGAPNGGPPSGLCVRSEIVGHLRSPQSVPPGD